MASGMFRLISTLPPSEWSICQQKKSFKKWWLRFNPGNQASHPHKAKGCSPLSRTAPFLTRKSILMTWNRWRFRVFHVALARKRCSGKSWVFNALILFRLFFCFNLAMFWLTWPNIGWARKRCRFFGRWSSGIAGIKFSKVFRILVDIICLYGHHKGQRQYNLCRWPLISFRIVSRENNDKFTTLCLRLRRRGKWFSFMA